MLWFWDCSRTAPILHNVQLRDFWPGLSQRLANPIRYTIGDMPEDYPEPETAPEPVPTPSPAKPEIILDNLAEQLRLVLDGQRLLQHDVTVMAALVPAIANSQAAVLDELHTIREILARLDGRDDEALRSIRTRLDAVDEGVRAAEERFDRWVAIGAGLSPAFTSR